MVKRLLQILALGGLTGFVSLLAADGSCEAAVVFRSGSAAYDDAVRGIRESTADGACRIRFIDAQEPAAAIDQAIAASPRLVVVVGVGAYEQFRNARPNLALLPALVLRGDLPAGAKRAGAVYADVPLTVVLERLHALFPKRTRIGLIRRPSAPPLDAGTKDRARQLGMELRVVECPGPERLLAAFGSLRGWADFLIADPDPELYNSATLKPLILASLDQRLPIAGFSPAFVHAGALMGVYPDFYELGRETGGLTEALLQGRAFGTEESVRKVRVGINQQIVRLMGIEPARLEDVEVFK